MALVGLWNPVLGVATGARRLRANVVLSGVGVVILRIIVVLPNYPFQQIRANNSMDSAD